jgi:hypothetical protein
MTLRHAFALILTSAAAACHGGANGKPPPEQVNLELTGTPECLADAMVKLHVELQVPFATLPVWSKDQIGRQEFGPIETKDLRRVREGLRSITCLRQIRQRPCATPLTDVVFCRDRH